MVSLASTLVIAFAGYALSRELWDKTTAYFTFLMLMVSPNLVFFSSFAYSTEPTIAFTYVALLLFVLGLRRGYGGLLFFSGLSLALAFSTRYTSLLFAPVFMLAYYFKDSFRGVYVPKRDAAIFFVFLLGIILVYGSHILASYAHMERLEGIKDLQATYTRDVPHYSSFILDYFHGPPIRNNPLYYVVLGSLYWSPLIWVIAVIAMAYALYSRDFMLTVFSMILIGYFVYYSFMTDQSIQYFNDLNFPLAILAARMCGVLVEHWGRRKKWLTLGFTVLILGFSAHTISGLFQEPFRGVSALMDELGSRSDLSFLINDNALAFYLLHSDMENMSYKWQGNPKDFSKILAAESFDYVIITPVFDRGFDFTDFDEEFMEELGYARYKTLSTGRYVTYEVYSKA